MIEELERIQKELEEMKQNEPPLGEIHIVETSEGRLHLTSKVFEREEIIGSLWCLATMMLNEENQDNDYDIFKEDMGRMIFELMKQRNMLKKKIQLFKTYLIKWAEELQLSGVNSKASVRAEIEAVLEDMKNDTNWKI